MSKVNATKCDICERTDDNPAVAMVHYKRKKLFKDWFGRTDKEYQDFDICSDCMFELKIKMKLKGETKS